MEPNASEQQHRQEELDRMVESLPEELQSLCASGKAVLDLAHLVKNILQMVSGSAEIIELGLERKQYDRVIKSWTIFEPNYIRLKKLVLDLIKFTKQYPLHSESCDINQLIPKAIKNCEHFLKNYKVEIQFKPSATVPAAMMDSEKVGEITVNLITHALDNLPEHQGTIVIRTDYLQANREIEISANDNGPILSMELIKSLRQPFERTRNMCGTGFDIPLAALYAQQHGGYLEIESSPEKGNGVHVYLPVQAH